MSQSNRKKNWQINVVVDYYDLKKANSYRFNLLELLKQLASVYRLDYAISVDHQFSVDTDSDEQFSGKDIVDLVYFRSNENSRIEKKDFRATIDCIFRKVPSIFYEGVDVFPQLYKVLKDFPFPTDFYRPLNYPYIEHYEDSQKTTLIYLDAVEKALGEEQDFSLN